MASGTGGAGLLVTLAPKVAGGSGSPVRVLLLHGGA